MLSNEEEGGGGEYREERVLWAPVFPLTGLAFQGDYGVGSTRTTDQEPIIEKTDPKSSTWEAACEEPCGRGTCTKPGGEHVCRRSSGHRKPSSGQW